MIKASSLSILLALAAASTPSAVAQTTTEAPPSPELISEDPAVTPELISETGSTEAVPTLYDGTGSTAVGIDMGMGGMEGMEGMPDMSGIDFAAIAQCIDFTTLTINDIEGCNCDIFVQLLGTFADFLPPEATQLGLSGMVTDCCAAGVDTPNADFNTCLTAKFEEVGGAAGLGELFAGMVPGPGLPGAPGGPAEETTTGSTEAAIDETVTGSTEAGEVEHYEGDGHDHGEGEEHTEGDGHDHGEEETGDGTETDASESQDSGAGLARPFVAMASWLAVVPLFI